MEKVKFGRRRKDRISTCIRQSFSFKIMKIDNFILKKYLGYTLYLMLGKLLKFPNISPLLNKFQNPKISTNPFIMQTAPIVVSTYIGTINDLSS
jgi:hypothetical protein